MIMESMENTGKQEKSQKGKRRSEDKQFYYLCTMTGNSSVFSLLNKVISVSRQNLTKPDRSSNGSKKLEHMAYFYK